MNVDELAKTALDESYRAEFKRLFSVLFQAPGDDSAAVDRFLKGLGKLDKRYAQVAKLLKPGQ